MKTDILQQYVSARKALLHEKVQLQARLHQIQSDGRGHESGRNKTGDQGWQALQETQGLSGKTGEAGCVDESPVGQD